MKEQRIFAVVTAFFPLLPISHLKADVKMPIIILKKKQTLSPEKPISYTCLTLYSRGGSLFSEFPVIAFRQACSLKQ